MALWDVTMKIITGYNDYATPHGRQTIIFNRAVPADTRREACEDLRDYVMENISAEIRTDPTYRETFDSALISTKQQ